LLRKGKLAVTVLYRWSLKASPYKIILHKKEEYMGLAEAGIKACQSYGK